MVSSVHERIDSLVKSNQILLFMKGNKRFPQCGFSSSAVDILSELGMDFETVDVLQDPEIRQGIKVYSDWPTIPQLYIKQEFVGGSDILRQMFANGELHALLGLTLEEVAVPKVTITDAAAEVFLEAAAQQDDPLRLRISSRFQYSLNFGAAVDGDYEVSDNGVTLWMDRGSASRADGMTLDFRSGASGGVSIDNPNEPAKVKLIGPQELKRWQDEEVAFELFDVREPAERATAMIPNSRLLDAEGQAYLEALAKDTKVVFHCHHGSRSQSAAEHYLQLGFTDVSNLRGGIDAWSLEVDTSVPRY